MSDLPLVSAEWLRLLALLVEEGTVSVIRCDVRPKGVMLGIMEPREGPMNDAPLTLCEAPT